MMLSDKLKDGHSFTTNLSCFFAHRHGLLEQIEHKLKILIDDIRYVSSDQFDGANLTERVKNILNEISSSLKEYYVHVVGITKVFEKEYTTPYRSYIDESYPKVSVGFEDQQIFSPELNDSVEDSILMRLIIVHLYRFGLFDAAEELERESNIKITPVEKDQFKNLSVICSSLDRMGDFDIGPLILWINSLLPKATLPFKEELNDLLFQAHSLKFTTFVVNQEMDSAIHYSKMEISSFFQSKYVASVKKLMLQLVFPNMSLSLQLLVDDLKSRLLYLYCKWIKLPAACPLELCLSLGISNLPTILKATDRLLETNPSLVDGGSLANDESLLYPGTLNKWKKLQELPIEVPIPPNSTFHSIFTCPVSKQTASIENPPLRIACGHVISKEAVGKLSKAFTTRFKCPYCPVECDPNSCLELVF